MIVLPAHITKTLTDDYLGIIIEFLSYVAGLRNSGDTTQVWGTFATWVDWVWTQSKDVGVLRFALWSNTQLCALSVFVKTPGSQTIWWVENDLSLHFSLRFSKLLCMTSMHFNKLQHWNSLHLIKELLFPAHHTPFHPPSSWPATARCGSTCYIPGRRRCCERDQSHPRQHVVAGVWISGLNVFVSPEGCDLTPCSSLRVLVCLFFSRQMCILK